MREPQISKGHNHKNEKMKTSTDRGRGDAYCSRKSRLHVDDKVDNDDELAMMTMSMMMRTMMMMKMMEMLKMKEGSWNLLMVEPMAAGSGSGSKLWEVEINVNVNINININIRSKLWEVEINVNLVSTITITITTMIIIATNIIVEVISDSELWRPTSASGQPSPTPCQVS